MSWTLIAGGSSGIGAEIAYTYAKLGANLVVTGRPAGLGFSIIIKLSKYKNRPICCDHQ